MIDLGVKAFKIGSGEFNNIPLLDRILEVNNSALIASTGMQKIEDVIEINNYIRKKTDNIILMHTTNLQLTPASLVRLESIREIMEECGTLNVGPSTTHKIIWHHTSHGTWCCGNREALHR